MQRNKNKPATKFVQDIFYMLLREACCEGTVRKCPFHKQNVGRHFLGSAYGVGQSGLELKPVSQQALLVQLCFVKLSVLHQRWRIRPILGGV